MATENTNEATDKQNDQSAELTKALNDIINQNLTIGISKLGDYDDFNDDHADLKSNASSNFRRGYTFYSLSPN